MCPCLEISSQSSSTKRLLRTSISCNKSLARWILSVAKKAIQNYFPISHDKTYYKGSGRRSCVCFYEKNLIDSILRHLNIDYEEYVDVVEAYRCLAVRSGKALRLTKGITGKSFSGVYRCHHNFPTIQFCGKLPWDEHVRYEQHEQQTVAFLGHCRSTDLCSHDRHSLDSV